jgi:hypothetical protein
VPAGQPFEGGTAALAAVVTFVEPAALVATTETRNVLPSAAPDSVYVLPVAPTIVAQLSPFASQRSHVHAYEVGLPLHVPLLAVRVEPTWSEPEIVGAAVFVGAAALEMTADGAEVERAEPLLSVAVTVTRTVCPTSAATGLYVAAVAPETAAHEPPLASHRLHTYA